MARKIARPEAGSRVQSKRKPDYANNKENSKVQSEFLIPASLDYQELLKQDVAQKARGKSRGLRVR